MTKQKIRERKEREAKIAKDAAMAVERADARAKKLTEKRSAKGRPIPMILFCPLCKARHLDVGEFATKRHHTHACQGCGFVWRPAVVATVGVDFLPGFKNDD